MRSFNLSLLTFLALGSAAPAQPAPERPAREVWETVFARDRDGRDQQIGYSHLTFETLTVDGKTIVRGTRELRIHIKRDGQLAQLKADTGTEEVAEDGKVVGVFMRHWIGEKQALTMNGKLDADGKAMSINVDASVKNEFKAPWDPKVIGLAGEQGILRNRKAKAGDAFSYRFFEPTVSSIVTVAVSVKDVEEVLPPRGGKKKLLRVESKPEKIQGVQLPSSILFVDPQTYEPVMTQTDMPDLGLLTLLRSDKAAATGPLGEVPDLMKLQTIRLGQRINGDIHALQGVVFRVSVKGKDIDAGKLLKEDDRQSVKNLEGNVFDLHVTARRAPRDVKDAKEPGEEFTKSNYFINSDDAEVKKLAAEAVGAATDPWEKAKKIERLVREKMKPVNYSEAMATADHVAKTLAGDCSEYSMLAAAMCRAEGIPSRTAIGLVYVDSKAFGGPALAFHMWTEVYVKGQWLAIDATLGRGGVGPGHIKITDHSWHETRDFKPLLPVTGFIMAKPTVEIKEATRE
jgi:hypothetical protein